MDIRSTKVFKFTGNCSDVCRREEKKQSSFHGSSCNLKFKIRSFVFSDAFKASSENVI